jgi:flagellar M-ring protein FliF
MLNQLREQFARFWGQQSGAQKIVMVVIVGLGLVLIPLFLTWANTPSYSVAFSGLSESDAGQIVEKLNENNISYKLQSSGTILVPSNKVYEARLAMAREGLPQGTSVGLELFSGNTFGMTEFSQRVNYQRAIEGELERTIGSLASVEAVRVHLVLPEKSLLASEQAPTTASVTIMQRAGAQLDASQVRAITHLVASSVEGLQPENVVVVDVNGNMLASGNSSGESGVLAQTDTRRSAELQVAGELESKVQRILDKALGPNKSVVQASVALDWTQRETTTQSYDPATTAVRSSQDVTETYTTTQGTLDGIPGATSNLPPGATSSTGSGQGINYSRNESTVNYEVTQVNSHQIDTPGEIKKVSLSVLVDVITDTAQLDTLRNVIGAAAGIDETRGDVLAVESLAFDRSFYNTQVADMEAIQQKNMYYQIAEIAAGVLALAAILWYVQRLLKNLRLASSEAWTPVLRPVSEMALGSPAYRSQIGASSERQPSQFEHLAGALAAQSDPTKQGSSQAADRRMPKIDIPAISPEFEKLQRAVADTVESDPSSIAEAIQLWLNEDENRNG